MAYLLKPRMLRSSIKPGLVERLMSTFLFSISFTDNFGCLLLTVRNCLLTQVIPAMPLPIR
jgi:hypothetical protein